MRRVALIPARGGSKRLPRKNILDFMGKPIIAWTIAAAQECGLFDDVFVSTDDPEIASVAESCGAQLDMRGSDLSNDSARVTDVCLDFLERRGNHDILCCLYATAPLRNASDIAATVNLVQPGVCDFSIAATTYDLPPHQALKLGKDNFVTPKWPELVNMRAADVGPLVVDGASTYAVNIPVFKEVKSFYGPRMRANVMPRERALDIDEMVDLETARFFAQRMRGAP